MIKKEKTFPFDPICVPDKGIVYLDFYIYCLRSQLALTTRKPDKHINILFCTFMQYFVPFIESRTF